MNTRITRYRHRFPPEIISRAVCFYHRFSLSYRDVEDLLAERGIVFSCESVRRWCLKYGPRYERSLKRREDRLGDDWFVDEAFISIAGRRHYLWRAVDQDDYVLDILVQRRRNRNAGEHFFRKVLSGQEQEPSWTVTDGLSSYPPAIQEVLPNTQHDFYQGGVG